MFTALSSAAIFALGARSFRTFSRALSSSWLAGIAVLACMTTVAHATISVAQVGSATVSSFTAAGSTSTLSNVPIAAGTNRLLVVSASDAASTGIVSVTYNGASMTRAVEKSDTSQAVDAFFYYLLGTSGSASTGTIVVLSNGSPSATGTQTIGAVVFQNVDQTTPVTSPVSNNDANGMTPNPSLTVVSKANDLVYDLLDVFGVASAPAATPNSPQTLVYSHNGPIVPSGGFGTYSTSSKAGAASVNTGWAAVTNEADIQIAIDINLAAQPPAISTATLPNWTVNKSGYLQTVVATGGTGASTFSVTAGSLPTGLSLNTSTGVVSGTPTAAGTYNFTITATDTVSATGSQGYTIVVNAAVSVSPSTLPNWTVNKSGYLQTVTSSGGTGARALSLTAGAIPTGMTFTAGTGILSGTPTAGGTYNFTITATDTVNATGSQAYTVVVNAAVSVSPSTLPNWTVNKSGYLQTVTATGGTGALTYTVTSGSLPTGLSLGSGTGVVSGTPTAAGNFNFTVTATDTVGATGSQAYSETINGAVSISTLTLPNWTVNKSGYLQTINTSGGTGAKALSITSGALPTGMTLSGISVSGTPTAAGTFNFTITATDTVNATGSQGYTIVVNAAVSISTLTVPNWTVNNSGYSQTVVASGGTGALTYTVTSGSLPTGLSLGSGTGVVSGTPTAAGNFNFTVTATDTVGATGSQAYSETINGAVSISTLTLPNWTVNQSGYLQTVTASGGTGALTYTVTSGALPAGLSLGSGTGVVSGTPTSAGTYNFTVTATDTVGATGSQAYTIVVGAAVNVIPASLPNWTVNKSGYLQTVTSTGGTGARALSLTAGAIPTGMTFTAGTGILNGTPTAAGTFNFTITATDTVGATGSQAYTIVVNAAVAVSPSTLPNATVNVSGYLQTVSASGGTGAIGLAVTSGAIPTGLTFTAGTGSLAGTPTAIGTFNFTVTGTDTVGATGSQAYTVVINPGVPTHFIVTAPGTATAGVSGSITVTAADAGGNTVTTYAGTVHFTSTDNQATLPADSTLTLGTGTFSVTFKTSGSQTVTAGDAINSLTGTSGTVTVSAAATTHLVVNAAGSATAGAVTSVNVTAKDQFNNIATAYAGIVHFTSTDAQAVLHADSTLTNGVGAFNTTLKTGGNQTVTATDTITGSITGTSGTITVGVGAPDHYVLTAPANASVAQPISVTVAAVDIGGNPVTAYTGTAHFTSTDPLATLPADTALVAGTGTFDVTMNTAGNETVTATDSGASLTGTAPINVSQGNATVTLSNLTPTYNGAVQDATVTTTPASLATLVTYNNLPEVLTPAGGTLATYSGAYGHTVFVNATGATSGNVYGTGPYAINSDIGTAAVHAGVLIPTQTAVLQILINTDLGAYTASTANTVTSQTEGAQAASFQIIGIATPGSYTTGPVAAGNYPVTATIVDANYSGSQSGTLMIAQATPVITWSNPANIPIGTPLSATQLNATVNVTSGSLSYAPISGTVLPLGTSNLTAMFTSTDPNYRNVSKQVSITVDKVVPVLSWNPVTTTLTYGPPLTTDQLNAQASVPGSFTYSSGSGAITAGVTRLPAGANQTLTATFTPTDAVNNATGRTVTTMITVNQATPTITWTPTPSTITYNTPIVSTQLNAVASVGGSYAYTLADNTTMALGATLPGGTQTLKVAFTPTDTANYTTASDSATITVNPASQTVTIGAVNNPQINVPITLSATASSGLTAFTYSVPSTSTATLSGNTLTLKDGNTVVVTAMQAGNGNYQSATGNLLVTAGKLAQTITFGPIADQTTKVSSLVLGATTTATGLTVTYTVTGATLSGSTVPLTGLPVGTLVTVTADQTGNATYGPAPSVTRTFHIISAPPAKIMIGGTSGTSSIGDDGTRVVLNGIKLQAVGTSNNIAVSLDADGKNGTLIGFLPSTGQGFVITLTPDTQGNFTATTTTVGGTGAATTLTISGVATLSGISGTIQPLGLTFGATPDAAVGPTSSLAGLYQSANVNGSSGTTYSIVGTQGEVFVLAVTPTVVASGSGTVAGNGSFNVQASSAVTVTGAVNVTNSTVTGTVSSATAGTVSYSGVSSQVSASKLLVNMSARAMVNPSSPLIVGFVVNGSVPKTVVLRGVGPGLVPFNLGATLAQPKLTLYDVTGAILATNTAWGGSPTLSAAFSRIGAFGLVSSSADAAIQTTLAPGPYTIVISDNANDAGGTTLAEIYDASIDPTETTQRLVNISSRGQVTPTNPLLGGFVVGGNTPKKVLIRAVGPGLAAFNVANVLADPALSVLDLSGNVVAQNNDWGTPQVVATGQAVASASDITAADTAAGAFPLVTGSKDSAIIVTLAPGNYSAVVSGSGGTSGAALVEVYELP